MGIFLGWFVFSFAAGVYASRLNRSFVLWTFVGLLISPVLAFLFLFAYGEDKESTKRKEANMEGNSRDTFVENLVASVALSSSGLLDVEELKNKKKKIFESIESYRASKDESLLVDIVKVNTESFLSKDDLKEIKNIIYAESENLNNISVFGISKDLSNREKAAINGVTFPFTYSWLVKQYGFHGKDFSKLTKEVSRIYPKENDITEENLHRIINELGVA